MAYRSDVNNTFKRIYFHTHRCTHALCKLSSDWLVKQVPFTGLTHNKWCKVNPVRAGLWCLCPSSCAETLAAGRAACNSYILTVRSLQVFTGVCHGCSRASWYEGWEPSAEFNNVSHFCSDWLAMWKTAAQTTLELCPVTVHQPSKIRQAELWERAERHLGLSRPAHPAGEWQHINKHCWSSQGLSFIHLISHGVGHRPDCPAS